MKKIQLALSALLVVIAANFSFGQALTGAKTIGGTSPDYATVTAAVSALTTNGVSGPVVFNIRSGTYSGQFTLPAITGASATNTITFQSDPANTTMPIITHASTTTSSPGNHTIYYNGADYITFKKLNIRNTGTSYARVIYMRGACTNNTVDSCLIEGYAFATTSSYHYVIENESSTSNIVSNWKVTNNTIKGGSYAIYNFGGSTSSLEVNNVISNNTIENFGYYGIYNYYQNNLTIKNNTIKSRTNAYSYQYGIYTRYCDRIEVSGNNVNISPSFSGYGFYAFYNDATSASPAKVYNNVFALNNSSSSTSNNAIYAGASTYLHFYYNSCYTRNTSTSSSAEGVYISTSTGCHFRNNNVTNYGASRAFYMTTSTTLTHDYNNFYTTGTTLGNSTTGSNSINVDPDFVSPSTGNLNFKAIGLDGKATPITGITKDINDSTRNATTPDIGAYEKTFPTNDAGIASFVMPPACAGATSVKVNLKNFGANAITATTINWSVTTNSGSPVSQTAFTFSGNLAVGADTTLTIGTITTVNGSSYTIDAYTSNTNSTTDPNNNNDSNSTSIAPALSGTFTVGTSGDYASLGAALTALKNVGMCGNVNLELYGETFTEQNIIENISGSETYNLTIRAHSSASTMPRIQYSSTSWTTNYVIMVRGTDNVTINGLEIAALNSSYGRVIELANGNENLTVSNNKLLGVSTTSASNYMAVFYDPTANDHNMTITNNEITNGSYSIYTYGSGSTNQQDTILVKGNEMNGYYYSCFYSAYNKHLTLDSNEMISKAVPYGFGLRAIYVNYNYNMTLTRNYVVNKATGYGSGIYANYCDGTSSDRTLIANNMFSTPNTNSSTSSSWGCNYINYCDYSDIVYNSWYGKYQYASSSYGLVRMWLNTAANFQNNTVYSTGNGRAFYSFFSGTGTKDYNNYYAPNAAAHIGGTAAGTNSINVDPGHLDAANGNLRASAVAMYRKGTPLTYVTDDIDGNSRHATTPSMGAHEFFIPGRDASPVEIVYNPSCPGTVTLRANIENKGLDTLTSFNVDWSVATNSGSPVAKTQASWSGVLYPGSDTVVTLGNLTIADGSTYTIEAISSSPNSSTDEKTSNDTLSRTIETAMSGTYTVGGLSPDFTTPVDAANALNERGLCGAVVIEVRPGNYNGRIYIGEVVGASSTNSITWRGANVSNTTLSYASSGNNYATVELDGSDFVTFKNLTVENTSTGSYASAFAIRNSSNDVTIDSCILETGSKTAYRSVGVLLTNGGTSSWSTGSTSRNITISNNEINNCYYGLSIYGSSSSSSRVKNVKIEDNTFEEIGQVGMYLYFYMDSVEVNRNDLSDFGGTSYGIYMYYNRNFRVQQNEVNASGNYAIYLNRCNWSGASTSSLGLVANNFFSQTGTRYSVYSYYTNYLDFYHNSVRSKSNYAFYDFYGSAKDIQNNIFYAESNYTWYSRSTSTSYITDMDNNLYYRGNSASVIYYGGARTLASMQTYRTTWNTGSAVGDPKFVASDDLRIANGKNADSLGATGLGITKDFFGTTRSTTHPDAGAHEYDYQPIDGYLVALTRPTGMCLSSTDTLEFAVVNVGGDTIQLGTNGVNIGWDVTGPNSVSGTDAANVGSVAPGDTVFIPTTGTTVDLSAPGKYTIKAYIFSSWDKYDENDTLEVELERVATESITAVKDTTVYYRDSLNVNAISSLVSTDVVLTEMCQWNTSTGAPSGGRPTYMNSEDEYVEISTGKGGFDMGGYTFERWVSGAVERSYTFASGEKTSPNGTLILGIGANAGDPVSPANFYYRTGGLSDRVSSSTPVGYIIKDPSGKIVDAAASNSFSFPAASGVTSADWSGNVTGSGSTHGIRRNAPDNNTATGWIRTSSTTGQRQDPNTLNAGLNLKSTSPPGFKWLYNGSTIDTVTTTQAGPWTAKGTKDYIASFVSPCSGDTIRDTATIVAYATNVVVSADAPDYYSYPLSQSVGVNFSGSVDNLGDAMTNVRVYATLSGSSVGDTLVSSSMARFDQDDFEIDHSGLSTTPGMKNITYYVNTSDDFINDDTAKTSVSMTDSVMARDNGMLNESIGSNSFSEFGQTFRVFAMDSVTGAQISISSAFAGDEFSMVLYEMNGSSVGNMINETHNLQFTTAGDTGMHYLRFKCLSVLDTGMYLLAMKKKSTVFSSLIGGSKMNASSGTAFGNNGSWTGVTLGGDPFNFGIRMVFGSYDYPTFAAVAPACITGDKFALTGGMPSGGSYYGTGVMNDTLDPTALSAGTHMVYYEVANGYGCKDTIASSVDIKAVPTVSSTFTNLTSCVIDNASISVTASNGFGTFMYSNNGGTSYSTSSSFTNLGSGSYSVMVKDSVCVVSDTTYVASPPNAPNAPSASGGATYCKGATLSSLTASTNTSGTVGTFKWYTDGSLTQLKDSGSTITVYDSIATITYYVIEERNGCTSPTDTTSVTINALPVVSNSALSNRCTNADTLSLTTGTPSGGMYSGNGVNNGVFNPDSAGAGTHVITYSYTDGNNCTNSDTASVTIYQAPVVSLGSYSDVCSNTPSFSLTGGTPSGGTYSGFGVSTGSFDANTAGIGLHAVQYKVTNTNCADSASQNIRVHLAPVASFSSISDRCLDAPALTLTGGAPSGGVYSGSGVSTGSFDPGVAGSGTHTLKYIYTNSNNCIDSATTTAHVDSLPNITFTSLADVCDNTPTFALTNASASPAGGSGRYFGTGVISPTFVASTAGSGAHTIGYTYTDGNGCKDTAYQAIQVHAQPTASLSTLADLCADAGRVTLSGGVPSTGIYKGPGVFTGGIFDVDTAGVGSHTINYVVTDVNGCMDSASQTQVVNPLPVIGLNLPANWCLNASAINLNMGTPAGGSYTINGAADSIFNRTAVGVDTVVYSYTDSNTCSNSAMALVTVDTVPVVTFGAIPDICIGSPLYALSQGLPLGGNYHGTRVTTGRYRSSVAITDTLTYIYTDANNCTDSAHSSIVVHPLPVVGLSAMADVCENTPVYALAGGTPTGGTYKGGGVSAGNYDASSFGVGTDNITYVFTDANNCTDSNSVSLNVNAVTSANLKFLGFACDNEDPVDLSSYGTPSGGVYSGAGVTGSDFDPSVPGAGNATIGYTFTNADNCVDSVSGVLEVRPSPNAQIMGDTTGCGPGENRPTLVASPAGMTYKWSNGLSSDTIIVTQSGTIWLKVIDGSTSSRCSAYDTVNVTYEAECLGVDEGLLNTTVRYYPNPNDGNFNYSIEGFEGLDVHISIHSLSGQIVFEEDWYSLTSSHTGSINADVVESGVYFITLTTKKGAITHRISINK